MHNKIKPLNTLILFAKKEKISRRLQVKSTLVKFLAAKDLSFRVKLLASSQACIIIES